MHPASMWQKQWRTDNTALAKRWAFVIISISEELKGCNKNIHTGERGWVKGGIGQYVYIFFIFRPLNMITVRRWINIHFRGWHKTEKYMHNVREKQDAHDAQDKNCLGSAIEYWLKDKKTLIMDKNFFPYILWWSRLVWLKHALSQQTEREKICTFLMMSKQKADMVMHWIHRLRKL